MKNRNQLFIALIILAFALWVMPVHSTAYAADEDTSATIESEEGSVRGPGAVIIMVGLGAIGLVGLAYSTRSDENTETQGAENLS